MSGYFRIVGLVCLMLTACFKNYAQTSLVDSVITPAAMEKLVAFLASDSMQGRFTGTTANKRAAEFIANEFKRAGIKQVAGNEGYFMPFATTDHGKLLVTQNVVGALPGKTRPDEVVVFCAHYDHVGTHDTNPYKDLPDRATQGGDFIYNGANDNASGVAGVIALARYFGRLKNNDRTILFIAFSGEELGLHGSAAFVKNIEPANYVAVINLEMIGRSTGGNYGQPYVTGSNFSDLRKILNEGLKDAPRKIFQKDYFRTDLSEEGDLFQRSDNYSFAELGIPAHSIMIGGPADPYYHSTEDEVSTLNPKQMADIVQAVALASARLIDGSVKPVSSITKKPPPVKYPVQSRTRDNF